MNESKVLTELLKSVIKLQLLLRFCSLVDGFEDLGLFPKVEVCIYLYIYIYIYLLIDRYNRRP